MKKPLFEFILELPVLEIRSFLSKNFESLWIKEYRILVLRRILNISDKEIKNVDKNVVYSILNGLKSLFESGDENLDMHALKFVQKMISCEFMEKRLKGLNELKENIDIVTEKDPAKRRLRSFSSEALARWMVDNQIPELIMHNAHEEMIKRSSTIFAFIAFHKLFSQEHVDLLWNYSKDRHDSIQSAVHSVILDSNKYLTSKIQKLFFEKFLSLAPEDYDDKLIETLTDLIKKSDSLCDQAVDFMYSLLMSQNDQFEKSVTCFITVLTGTKNPKMIETYLEKSINNIKSETFICQSFDLAIQILKLQMPAHQKTELYKKLFTSSTSLIDLLAKSFDSLQNEKRPENLNRHIKTRLRFWKFLMKDSGFEALADDILVVKNSFCNFNYAESSSMFWKSLLKLINQKFSIELSTEILEKMFLTRDPKEVVNEESFEVFLSLFLKVNYYSRNIEIKHEKFYARLNENLVGYPFLVDCVFGGLAPSIESKAMKTITLLKLKLSRNLISKSEEIWEFYIKSLQNFLNKDPSQIEKSLQLVLLFLDGIKVDEAISENCTVCFKTSTEAELNRLPADLNSSIITIRKKISDTYKKPVSGLILVNPQGDRIDSLYNDYPLSTWRPPFIFTVDFSSTKETPLTTNFFSKCQDFQLNLLEILPSLNKTNAELAWTILSRVQLISKYVNQFLSFESLKEEVFTTSSIYQLVYNLKIIEFLTKKPQWLSEFQLRSGFEHIKSVFLSHSLSSSESLCLEYNTLIISILSSATGQLAGFSEDFMKQVLKSLIQAADLINESEQSSLIAKNSKDILTYIRNTNEPMFISVLRSYPIDVLIRSTIITCSCSYFSSVMCSFFLEQSQYIPTLTSYFLENLLSLLDEALKHHTSDGYWNLLSFYINDCEINDELKAKLINFVQYLESHPCEASSKDCDIVLSGLLKVQKTIFDKLAFEVTESFVKLIIHSCLFEIPSLLNLKAPKCKHQTTRRDAFELLYAICKSSRSALDYVIDYLKIQHEDPSWRTCKNADWNYHPRELEKSETGFVGMKNLGCICYMISTLQQFYHVPLFRETLLRIDKHEQPLDENLLYQLQNLFSGLKNSDKRHVNPKGVCKAFKDWEGRPVNVKEQMDADEFINTFMDRIENQIKGQNTKDIVKQLFGGELATELIGQGSCGHRSERSEAFITLPVQVKGQKDLIESLKTFKAGELLQGSNAYQCDHCESKVTAVRRVCIKYLPNILIVTLRRFEFNYDLMKRLKVNDYCEFPMELDMESFTQEGIERLETMKAQELAGDLQELPKLKYPEEYYKYKLRGIIIHLGTADNGHYYSFIRHENQWLEFNDTNIRVVDPRDIPGEAFGGEEKFAFNGQSNIKYRNRNAYILLYERTKYFEYLKAEEKLECMEIQQDLNSHEIEFSEVKEENEKYWRCRSSFSPEYFDFISRLFSMDDEKTSKFTISFLLTVMIRSKDYMRIVDIIKRIKDKLPQKPALCEWLLELASVPQVTKELLMDCPVVEKRRLVVGLLHTAAANSDKSIQELFIKRLLAQIDQACRPESFNFANYFELIFRLSQLNIWSMSSLGLGQRLMRYLRKMPQESLIIDEYKNSDIYLGYNHFTHCEKQEPSIGANGSSLAFLYKTLASFTNGLRAEDSEYFFQETSLDSLLVESQSRFAAKAVTTLLCKLCKDHKTNWKNYGSYLINGVDKEDYDKHKPYMRQLFALLSINDSLTAERTSALMTRFFEQLKKNSKFPVATESSVDFVIKCAAKISAVANWIQKNKNENRILGSVLPEPVNRNPAKSKDPFIVRNPLLRLENLKKVTKGNYAAVDLEDSDGETFEGDLQKGAGLEVFEVSLQKWVPCSVLINGQEIVQIKNEAEGINRWVDRLSDFLRVISKRNNN